MPYIASEFDVAGINFPCTFGVGNESEPNDFPNQYRNGPVIAGRNLDCFVRYFVSTEVRGEQAPHAHSSPASLLACVFSLLQVMPMARRRRDAFLTDSTTSSSSLNIQLYIEVKFGGCGLLDTYEIV